MKKRILAGVVFLLLLTAFLLRANYVLMPDRLSYGAVWSMYLEEPRDTIDVLFFGSSLAYCNVVPAEIYEQTGLTSFVMAGPEQTFPVTYDYIKESLKTQSPSVIFVEVTGMLFSREVLSAKENIGYMPFFSCNRLEAALFGTDPTERMGLLFPLYSYHDRLADFPPLLFRTRHDEVTDPLAGATLMQETRPQDSRGPRPYSITEEEFANNLRYLEKIRSLCAKQGIQLVLFQVPSCGYLPREWMDRIRSAAGENAPLVDFNERFAEIGLDPEKDFYDFIHFNASGAVKFTRVLAEDLSGREVNRHSFDQRLWQWRVLILQEIMGPFSPV